MKKVFQFLLGSAMFFIAAATQLQAQANLSVQGSLQNFNGTAVDNGVYDITFKLYTTDAGGTAIWSEVQSVSVVNGVYSVHLGEVNPLNVPFDQTYYLGLTIPGGPEHTPRARLTSSPYALSLIGQDNVFPSTGNVGIGTTAPTTGLDANSSISTATVTTSAAAYTVLAADHVVFLDLAGAQAVTLPSAATFPRREIVLINKTSTAKTVSSYVNLAGAAATAIPANGMIELRSNGTEWRLATTFAPPGASAKAYVLAIPTTDNTTPSGVWTTIALTEVEDAQNCFASNTFTAPRTGFYRISSMLHGILINSPWPSGSSRLLIRSQGTCAFGVASRQIFGSIQVPTTVYHFSVFSADVYMTAGQTLFLQIWQANGQPISFNGNADSYLNIVEQ